MAVCSIRHPDILEFIHCKDKEGDLKNFNVSVGLTDDFMSQVVANSSEPWLCTFNGESYKPRRITRDNNWNVTKIEDVTMTARELFVEIVASAYKTGEPGCVFLDTVNNSNPLPGLGRLEASNPCKQSIFDYYGRLLTRRSRRRAVLARWRRLQLGIAQFGEVCHSGWQD
jgi:ribonucleoside-diphosphate reductase alpha chain